MAMPRVWPCAVGRIAIAWFCAITFQSLRTSALAPAADARATASTAHVTSPRRIWRSMSPPLVGLGRNTIRLVRRSCLCDIRHIVRHERCTDSTRARERRVGRFVVETAEIEADGPLWHTKVFLFSRAGGRDFTERDCAVLDALRPYLGARYALWEARQRLDVESVAAPDALTAREQEIVVLLRAGLTNAEIAGRLSIAPGTLRRHLENVYGKLEVHTRTAALAKLRMA